MLIKKGLKKPITVNGKVWPASWQGWSWIITIVWMTIANFWHPFGLYGLVCMFTPIIIALSGRGKMSCARICPRGSFIGLITRPFKFFSLKRPALFNKKGFKFFLWALMMGSFAGLMIWTIPKGDIYQIGFTILVFMEVATALAVLFGILFTPRAWCTVCPMGTTTGKIRDLQHKRKPSLQW
jgi:hypothetical protein